MATNNELFSWEDLERLCQLGGELKRDPLELALEELGRYKTAIREVRLERDRLRAELYGRFGS